MSSRTRRSAAIVGSGNIGTDLSFEAPSAQAERLEVSPVEILSRAGDRRLVGGQEGQLIDIARELQREASPP